MTLHTPSVEERWREIGRQLGELGYSGEMIDAIPTEEAAWDLIEKLTPHNKANGGNGHAATVAPQPEQPPASESQAPPVQPNGDAAEHQFDDDVYELPIEDPTARSIVYDTIKAMRAGTVDKLKAISAARRQLDPITQGDAIDYLSEVAIENLNLDPDAVQLALAHGARLREQDHEAGRLGKDRSSKDGEADDGFLGFWHGEVQVEQSRPWLVRGTIPEVGCGLLSGQWGTYKTFGALDLAAAAMTGTAIFGSEIDRRGGVLLYAAEGESEVPIRVQAVIEKRCAEMESPPIKPQRAPFIWLTPEKLPLCLLDPKSVERFIERIRRIDAEMQKRFNVPLVLIIIDTVVATAGYKKPGDENDSVLGTRLMREGLRRIGHETHTFALGTDHFGKDAETATRGTSSKEDNSDVVLVTLGDKKIEGIVTNPRVAVRKVRGGAAGREYPFSTRVVQVGEETTLVIAWAEPKDAAAANPTNKTDGWGSGVGMATLRKALLNADIAKAIKSRPWGADGPEVTAFPLELIKAEFYATYTAKGETKENKTEATRKAWNDTLGRASQRDLIGYRLINEAERIWLGGKPQPPQEPKL
jgi:hypothetical protein